MTATLFEAIKLPYLRWRRGPVDEVAVRAGSTGTPNLPGHLLRDIGLLDGHETPRVRVEPPTTARDMMERYR